MCTAIVSGDWGSLAMCALSFIPGGKVLGKLGLAGKAGKAATNVGKNAAKGKAFESFLVKTKNYIKNTNTIIGSKGKSWKPDFISRNGNVFVEAKATKYLSNSKQMRAMCEFATNNPGKTVILETLDSTVISDPLREALDSANIIISRNNWMW